VIREVWELIRPAESRDSQVARRSLTTVFRMTRTANDHLQRVMENHVTLQPLIEIRPRPTTAKMRGVTGRLVES
jgi:hypothetical protein